MATETGSRVLIDAHLGTVYPLPFGRVATTVLPDGTYFVAVDFEGANTGVDQGGIKMWHLDEDLNTLAEQVIIGSANEYIRPYAVSLEDHTVMLLSCSNGAGGKSFLVDCSDGGLDVVATYDDEYSPSLYGDSPHQIYLRELGIAVVMTGHGIRTYRRGEPLGWRKPPYAGVWGYGLWPHPTDPHRFACWRLGNAWETRISDDGSIRYSDLAIPWTDNTNYMVGAGSPYDADCVFISQESTDRDDGWSDYRYAVVDIAGTEVTNTPSDQWYINGDEQQAPCVLGPKRYLSVHEVGFDPFNWQNPDTLEWAYPTYLMPGLTMDDMPPGNFAARLLDVDYTTSPPTVEQTELFYSATAPSTSPRFGPDQQYYVSLNTGSLGIHHRDGKIIVGTCIVMQDSSDASTNFENLWAVQVWTLDGGARSPIQIRGATEWRRIGDGKPKTGGRLGVKTPDGWAHEVRSADADKKMYPLRIRREDHWDTVAMLTKGEPAPVTEIAEPNIQTVIYRPHTLNADLAVANTMMHETYGTWGQLVPPTDGIPAETAFADGSDETRLKVLKNMTYTAPHEALTLRMAPTSAPPAGSEPLSVKVRYRAWSDNALPENQWPEFVLGISGGRKTFDGMGLPCAATPATYERWLYGANGGTASAVNSDEATALWWQDFLSKPESFLLMRTLCKQEGFNSPHTNLFVSEFEIEIQYLLPE